jgi:hypothetical protein
MFNSNDMLAIYVRIGLLAVERFAGKTGDTFTVCDTELPALTGKRRIDTARTSLLALAELSPISVRPPPDLKPTSQRPSTDLWTICIPNFAKKQGFGSKNVQGTSPSDSEHRTPNTDTESSNCESDDSPGGNPSSEAPTGQASDPKPQLVLVEPDPEDLDIEAEVFAEVCEAVGEYHPDRKSRAWKLSDQRRARMRAVAREHGPQAPVDAFHGFVAYHVAGGRWPAQLANLNPETIWRPSNVTKYLEADAAARSEGRTPPYAAASSPNEPGWLAQTRRIAAREGITL